MPFDISSSELRSYLARVSLYFWWSSFFGGDKAILKNVR